MNEVKIEVIMYECEVCGAQYTKSKKANLCERQHKNATCKHENVTFHFEKVKKGYDKGSILLLRECTDCITYFQLWLSELSNESLAEVWSLVVELNKTKILRQQQEEILRDPNGLALVEIFKGVT